MKNEMAIELAPFGVADGVSVADLLEASERLEHLAHGQVNEAQALARRLPIEPLRLRRHDAVQVVHPDGGVDEDHGVTGGTRRARAG